MARSSRTYAPIVTAPQEPTSISRAAERAARIVLIGALAPVIPGVALIIWAVGFAAHPHRLILACIVAAIAAAIAVSYALLVYRLRKKQVSRLLSGDDSYQ